MRGSRALGRLSALMLAVALWPPAAAAEQGAPGYAWDVAIAGDRAYVADGGSGLRVFDITDPMRPRAIGGVLTPDDGLPGWEVMAIRETPDGAMWLATSGGVARVAPEAVESVFARAAWAEGR